jgi:hypothetical protein
MSSIAIVEHLAKQYTIGDQSSDTHVTHLFVDSARSIFQRFAVLGKAQHNMGAGGCSFEIKRRSVGIIEAMELGRALIKNTLTGDHPSRGRAEIMVGWPT